VAAAEESAGDLVAPGSWPDDPAGPDTPVAHSAGEVTELADGAVTLRELTARQSVCRACPRLVAWREQVAVTRRRAFRGERYWGRPVTGWGSERPRLLIVGLAPAAHGGNRTGRIFTGDRSGDFLFASLYRCGFAVQPTSVAAGDGQRLLDARMVAAVGCAPPDNKPEPAERDTCAAWLVAELRLVVSDLRAIVCLGGFAWQAIWPACWLSAAITRASRIHSPAGSPRQCLTRYLSAPAPQPGCRQWLLSANVDLVISYSLHYHSKGCPGRQK
jgi:uracil-DNA glycosylase family 4